MSIALRTQKAAHRNTQHAVHSLDRVVLTVPDIPAAQAFTTAFGLDVRAAGNRLDLHTFGHPHRWVELHAAPDRRKLQYLRFACFAEDFDAIVARMVQSGVARSAPHALGNSEGAWFCHPDGFPVQLVVGPKTSPDSKSPHTPPRAVPVGSGAAPTRSQVLPVQPRRLSHVAFFSAALPQAIAFYEALGLRVTDRSGDIIVFLSGIHGSDHHMVALLGSEAPGVHHTSWDVGAIDEVGMGMEQMLRAGYPQGWGVGRHVLGSNYFYYARAPWDSYCEYSFDIDYVPGDHDWQGADYPPEDSFYVWGPAVPPEFVLNGEAPAPAANA